jgi:2-succinyl-6-hydroxy-2,4-cyclohexadiene-1-carboxylate synthase
MARTPVMFLPGFMQHGDAWAPVAERVGERYPSTCVEFTSSDLAGLLDEIYEACPGSCAAVGYSMGGRLLLQAAIREPDRFAALVLVGATPGIEDAEKRAARRSADDELATWMERRTIEEIVDIWEAQPVFASQSRRLRTEQRAGRLAHEPARLAALLRSAGQGALGPAWDRMAELEMPILALAGELDRPYARTALRMAEMAPRAIARTIEGAGHAPQLEAPGAVASLLLEFLDEHLGDGPVID